MSVQRSTDSGARDVDAALVARITAGDERALGELYDRVGVVAFNLAVVITGDREVAESVVADAFARLWEDAGAVDPERASVLSWITQTVRVLSIAARRHETGKIAGARLRVPRAGIGVAERPPLVADPSLAPEVTEALEQLPDVQRRAIELAYFNGLTRGEIARELQLSEESVGAHLRSAIETVRQIISMSRAPSAPHEPPADGRVARA